MEELLQRIIEACASYCLEELDDAGFQKVINEIPTEVWQDKDTTLAIVKELAENEDLYEMSLHRNEVAYLWQIKLKSRSNPLCC